MSTDEHFILGVDLDGVVADFYSYMRTVAAEWFGCENESDLPTEVTWGLPEWGLRNDDYIDLHRFAVTQRDLFFRVNPVRDAPQSLRRLSNDGVRIRIITHRLILTYFHKVAVKQTIKWLDHYGVPYWDLCFMKEKGDVGADIYVEDGPSNITKLREAGKKVIIFTNSTNRHIPDGEGRAADWSQAEAMILEYYHEWCSGRRHPQRPQ